MTTATAEKPKSEGKSQALAVKERAEFLSQRLHDQQIAGALKALLPKGQELDRFVSMVITAVRTTPQLAMCSEVSLISSIMTVAQLGLELDRTLGQACIVPYFNKKKGCLEAQPQVMYRGFITLAHRQGSIAKISAEVVYEKDRFEVSLGTNRGISHFPSKEEDRGEMVGAYASVRFKDGSTDFEHLSKQQILKIRKSARGADEKDSPWQTHTEEMWRKTAIRRLCKYLPLSPDDALLVRAVVIDEAAEAGKPIEHPGIPPALLPALTEPAPTGQVIRDDARPTQEEPQAQPVDWGNEVPPPEEGESAEPPSTEQGATGAAAPTEFVIRCTWNTDRKTALISGHTDFVKERMRKVYGSLFDKNLGGYVLVASWVPDLKGFCDEKGIGWIEQ